MAWTSGRPWRRIPAALALLGMLAYALLLPGHLTSHFVSGVDRALAAEFSGAICHGGPASDESGKPAAPATNCPICKTLAGVAFSVPPATPGELVAPQRVGPLLPPAAEAVIGEARLAPRSRGPPLLA